MTARFCERNTLCILGSRAITNVPAKINSGKNALEKVRYSAVKMTEAVHKYSFFVFSETVVQIHLTAAI